MQSISPVTANQLLSAIQEPIAKFEIYVSAAWVNLCALGGRNYLEDWNISLGGAGMTPNPIGGTWSVTLTNENGIFHPSHPTSAYKDYFVTGRKARLSIGGKYGGSPYYWQRIIGYMDEPKFDVTGAKVTISGSDYMKMLEDVELRTPNNYWGSSQIFSSISSEGITGAELYNEVDAMDINNEANNVTNWSGTYCQFTSVADGGGGSTYVGKCYLDETAPTYPEVKNLNIFTPTAGKQYKFTFKYKIVTGVNPLSVIIKQGSLILAEKTDLRQHSYTEDAVYFEAVNTDVIQICFKFYTLTQYDEFRIDQFSIKEFVPYYERYYQLPSECKGPYRVILDSEDIWQGEIDEGWYYEESTKRLFFDINKTVSAGTNNLTIYYFTTQAMEDVLADLLVIAGLYVNRAAALADMDYTDPAVDIDQVWFDAGTPVLNAVKKICERCGTSGYRFWFKWDGKPVFKPKPSPGSTAFTFSSQKNIQSVDRKQDRGEIRNHIVIEGKEQAEPVNRDETIPPKLRGEDSDATSISTYGERTLTINNHLFQDQTSIDNMCSSLLAEFKDPKWYCDVMITYRPVPLEMGDRISFKERLSPSLEVATLGVIRDVKLSKWSVAYPCECV